MENRDNAFHLGKGVQHDHGSVRQSLATSLQRPVFKLRPVSMGFVVDKVVQRQASLQFLQYLTVNIPKMLLIHSPVTNDINLSNYKCY